MAKFLKASGLVWEQVGLVSLDVAAGQCLGVSGPSGSGKSVLLRMLADLVPHQGQCWLDGIECGTMPAPAWRRAVRYCAATPGWWTDRVGDHFSDLVAARKRANSVGLAARLFEQRPDQLSTGEKQRMALLRSLEDEPAFLLLDEPTSGLDEATTRLVEDLIAEQLRSGLGVVLVSHDEGQLHRLAGTVLEMGQ